MRWRGGVEGPGGRQRQRRGAHVVEFAFVAPVLLLFVFGMFEFGRGFMVTSLLSDAARRGCRVGIIEGTTTQQITDTVTTYLASQGINGDTVTVTIADGAGNVTEAANVPAYTELTVTVSVPVANVTWVPIGTQVYVPMVGSINIGINSTLQGQFTMRRE